MKLLFICGNGVSSSMIAMKTAQAGRKLGFDVDSEANSYAQLSEFVDEFDIVMVAPQVKFNENIISEICEEHHKKYVMIDPLAYASLNGNKVFGQVQEALGLPERGDN